MWRAPLVYGVTFLAIFGVLWLTAEVAWRWLRGGGASEQYVSDRWLKDVNTER
tara:strand:+ start:340 stop:498 length:159 start_codon:yes stop_codon:yes gene_type:complete